MGESTSRWVQDFIVKPYATPGKLESIDGENAPVGFFPPYLCHCCCCCLFDSGLSHIDLFQGPDTRYCSYQIALGHWMTWPTVALCIAFSHTSPLTKVSVTLILEVCSTCASVVYTSHVFVCAEPICAVGQGVSALCCATEGQKWIFSGYSLTGVSVSGVTMMKIHSNYYMFQCSLSQQLFSIYFWKPSVFELVRQPDFANLPLIVEDFVKDSGGSYTGRLICKPWMVTY